MQRRKIRSLRLLLPLYPTRSHGTFPPKFSLPPPPQKKNVTGCVRALFIGGLVYARVENSVISSMHVTCKSLYGRSLGYSSHASIYPI